MSARTWPLRDGRPWEGLTIVRRTIGFVVALGLFAASALPTEAAPPARAKLARSGGTPGLQHADKVRPADPRRQLTIGVNLALRNQPQLEAFITKVSDRKSPYYCHYLTPDQFAATYGPTQAQVQQVVDQLRASGVSLGSVSSNRTIVEAAGPVSAVEAAFGVTIFDWHDRDQNRDFFGNDSEPTLPTAVASYVVGVAGLNNHYPLHRLGSGPGVGGGPTGGYTPNELKKAYDVTPLASAGYTGSGQRLGLMELDGFQLNNIKTYDAQYGLGSPPPTTVVVPPGPGALDSNGGEIEVELDIEVMHAIAPASPITVWEGQNSDQGVNDTYNAIVTSNTTKSNSTSWGICEPNTTQAEMTILDNIFKQAAAQGQSFYAASGDNGAYDCRYSSQLAVDSPANDPYITGTGGTSLTLNTDSTYKTESTWSNPNTLPASGTGGGLSTYFARPTWQTGAGVANTYSNGKRQVPDVALDADPQTGYSVYVTYSGSTGWIVVGGTSAAAPSWAAFTGLYNQYAAANRKPNLGFANPALYNTASSAEPYAAFHDITTGNNLYYSATPNWDYATGWGSFDAKNLAGDLTTTYVAAVVGTDGALWVHRSGSPGFNSLGGVLTAAPAVVVAPSNSGSATVIYIASGSDHNLWVRSDTQLWQPLFQSPVYCLDNPAAAVLAGTLYVACQGADHQLWHAEGPISGAGLPQLTIGAWQSLGGVLTAGPALAPISGTPTYFVVGTDGYIWVRTLSTGFSRYPWLCIGHPSVATAATTSYFGCHGIDGALWYATNAGSGWSTAQSLGGQVVDGPGVAATVWGPNFFVQGIDNALWRRSTPNPWITHWGIAKYGAAAIAW